MSTKTHKSGYEGRVCKVGMVVEFAVRNPCVPGPGMEYSEWGSSRGLVTGYYKRGYIDSWDITDFNGNVFNIDDNEITQILSRVKQ
jgi:hypothetical protein